MTIFGPKARRIITRSKRRPARSVTPALPASTSKWPQVRRGPSKPDGNTAAPKPSQNASAAIEKVIQTGMKYLGTPYEFGSNRNTTTTFDSLRFHPPNFQGRGRTGASCRFPPAGSLDQRKSTPVYDVGGLKRGDILFFMSYRGSSSAAYSRHR
ncbi:hypothetical protein VQ056_03455 [Paenibacillus sp. JTLBN-2024]